MDFMKFVRDLYVKITPHPTRFYGDLQRSSGITNYHRKLAEFIEDVENPGLILDLGSGDRKITAKDKNIINFDYTPYQRVNVRGDAHRLPFKEHIFDGVILQQVLEHVVYPEKVLEEAKRVLKKGKRIWIEVPFIYPVHDSDDFWRWTQKGLDLVCSRHFTKIDAGVIMGAGSSMSVVGIYSFTILLSRGNRYLYAIFWILIAWLTIWLKYMDQVFLVKDHSLIGDVAAGVYFLGRK